MGNDIGTGLSLRAVCFDFHSTNIGSSVIVTHSTTGFDVIPINDIPYSELLSKYLYCRGGVFLG